MFIRNIEKHFMIRMLSARDAQPLSQLIDESRQFLTNWLPWLENINSEDDALHYIKNTLISFHERKSITAGIWFEEQFVGMIAYTELDFTNNVGHLGYLLGEKYQGKGLMTKSVTEMIDYGFHELSLNRIEMRISKNNVSSLQIPKKLGFTEEGCIREAQKIHDRYVDHVIFGLLRCEWKNH